MHITKSFRGVIIYQIVDCIHFNDEVDPNILLTKYK